jgi:dynein heavy chain
MAEFEFKQVVDIFFLAAMGLPGGGRSIISTRLVRHFNIIGYINISDNSIKQIFTQITNGFFEYNMINEE